MARGVQLNAASGLSQTMIGRPATQMRRGPGSVKVMVSSWTIASWSGGRADANRVHVEPRAAEVAAEPDRPGIHQMDHGGHDLRFARRAIGDGLHQIEQCQLECHFPRPSFLYR